MRAGAARGSSLGACTHTLKPRTNRQRPSSPGHQRAKQVETETCGWIASLIRQCSARARPGASGAAGGLQRAENPLLPKSRSPPPQLAPPTHVGILPRRAACCKKGAPGTAASVNTLCTQFAGTWVPTNTCVDAMNTCVDGINTDVDVTNTLYLHACL